jgi:hypothetical protein
MPERFPKGLVFEEVADATVRNVLLVGHESKEIPISCTKCNIESSAWWCQDCNVHLCRICMVPEWPTPQCTCTMMVQLWDPSFGSHWDKRQWIIRRLQWADPHDVDALIDRHDANMRRLRHQTDRDARWA